MIQNSKKVLIVEDDEYLVKALEQKFKHDGFEVYIAGNGVDGLVAAREFSPDIILLDILMPKMDGITMLKKLRSEKWGKKMRVIILTNLSDREAMDDSVRFEAYDYLIKSDTRLDDLVQTVRDKIATKK